MAVLCLVMKLPLLFIGRYGQHTSKAVGGYWVNPSKRGGMDGGFQGLAGLLRDFPRAKPEGNPEEQPCQLEENPVHPASFTWFYILFKI